MILKMSFIFFKQNIVSYVFLLILGSIVIWKLAWQVLWDSLFYLINKCDEEVKKDLNCILFKCVAYLPIIIIFYLFIYFGSLFLPCDWLRWGDWRVYTRVRKPTLRLLGIWIVSRAREEGLKGKVTG